MRNNVIKLLYLDILYKGWGQQRDSKEKKLCKKYMIPKFNSIKSYRVQTGVVQAELEKNKN